MRDHFFAAAAVLGLGGLCYGMPSKCGPYVGAQGGVEYAQFKTKAKISGSVGGVAIEPQEQKKKNRKIGARVGGHFGYVIGLSRKSFFGAELSGALQNAKVDRIFDPNDSGFGVHLEETKHFGITGRIALGQIILRKIGLYAFTGINVIRQQLKARGTQESFYVRARKLRYRAPIGIGITAPLSPRVHLAGELQYFKSISHETARISAPSGRVYEFKPKYETPALTVNLSYKF